jgi:magnesium and cobalt exporter, CNNM family
MTQFLLVIAALLLVVLNGFFVAAEFALVKLRNTRVAAIKATYGFRGEVLEKVHTHLDTYLSACQLGITLASLGLGWIGEPAFAKLLEPILNKLGIFSSATITAIAFFTAFFIISFLHIVLGELAPKSMAIRQPQRISLWTALPLYYFYWLMYPFIWLLNKSANFTIHSLGDAAKYEAESIYYSSEELKLILHGSHLHGEIEKEEAEILDNVLDFAELKVADIMRPIDEMVALSLSRPLEENLQMTTRYRFSRYPVYQDDPEKIIGILHIKDIFFAAQTNHPNKRTITELIRPILTINLDLPAIDLFRKFRAGLSYFALVKSSSDVNLGFVTLENILNALLGQIGDEFNRPKPSCLKTKEGNWLMKGNTPIYVLEKLLDITLPPTEANTISGLLLSKLERLPKPNELIKFDQFDITVLKIKGPRILLVKIHPNP